MPAVCLSCSWLSGIRGQKPPAPTSLRSLMIITDTGMIEVIFKNYILMFSLPNSTIPLCI